MKLDVNKAISYYNDKLLQDRKKHKKNNKYFDIDKNKKLTQKILAKEMGVHYQYFSKWNRKAPKILKQVLMIQKITGCPIDDFIINTESNES